MEENQKFYIEYLDASNSFKLTKKDFDDYEYAKKWLKFNIPNWNIDMIKFY